MKVLLCHVCFNLSSCGKILKFLICYNKHIHKNDYRVSSCYAIFFAVAWFLVDTPESPPPPPHIAVYLLFVRKMVARIISAQYCGSLPCILHVSILFKFSTLYPFSSFFFPFFHLSMCSLVILLKVYYSCPCHCLCSWYLTLFKASI